MMTLAMARFPRGCGAQSHRCGAGWEAPGLPRRAGVPPSRTRQEDRVAGLVAALPQGQVLAWLLGAAFAAGLARGFSGFGHALIFVPLAAIALGPQVAAPLMLAMEAFAVAALSPGAWRAADRREVGWLALGGLLGAPLGAAVLVSFEAVTLRWGMVLAIAAMLALLVSGWRFRGRPAWPLTVGVGGLGGLLSGIAMTPGPPVMAYLLGREADARQVRASFALFLAANWVVVALSFAAAGLLTAALLAPLAVALPVYAAGIWGGARLFGLASERLFRRACYAMIALAALLGLPAWDGVLR
jgi:hypothetical protein